MKRTLVFVVVALLAGSVSACRSERKDAAAPEPAAASDSANAAPAEAEGEGRIAVGGRMPGYEATTLDGRPFQLDDRRDKVVLLNIWATWCGPCRFEIPELQALHQKLEPEGFEVLGVSIDDSGAEQIVRDFVKEQGMTYPVVLDPEGRIADIFQTTVIPTSALIDKNGTILWVHRGIVKAGDPALTAALDKAL